MEIIETSVFTRQVQLLFSDEEYRLLQSALIQHPDIGKIIPRSGGLRKMRWSLGEKGKRSGTRIIYFWAISKEQLLMLYMYAKNQTDDLSINQLRQLESIIKKDYP
ncbi:MAG TPA: hypothetical protein DIW44_08605 [Anaerolineaceae bacterium]|nr:hypothetical protein [Anaerolineaceae bacterium]